jgi:hypothetical protein
MPRNDREVWELITKDDGSEIAYLTYAIYAFEKYDFARHFETIHGRPASQDEVDGWIAQVTPARFASMRLKAADLFDRAARAYLAADIEEQKRAAVNASIASTLRSASSWWKQLAVAVVAAIITPIVIGAAIVSIVHYDRYFPNASRLFREFLAAPVPGAPAGAGAERRD